MVTAKVPTKTIQGGILFQTNRPNIAIRTASMIQASTVKSVLHERTRRLVLSL
jgi:hypothetical protein